MMNYFVCPECGKYFQGETIDDCPVCAGASTNLLLQRRPAGARVATPTPSTPVANSKNKPVTAKAATLDDLVAAQNRTTHAIRALARFFFIWLRSGIVGAGLAGIGVSFLANKDLNGLGIFLVIVGWLITFIGFFYAFWQGMGELDKSQVH
jgi:hypothetical protein